MINLGYYLLEFVLMNKRKLLDLVIKEVELRYEALAKSALEAKDAATNEESKAENKYDTRGLEASYLAGAQAERSEKLKESLFYLQKITDEDLVNKNKEVKLLSIVKLADEDNSERYLFITPAQGGIKVKMNQTDIQTITLSSPIGKLLLSKKLGDEVSLKQGKLEKYFEVLSID